MAKVDPVLNNAIALAFSGTMEDRLGSGEVQDNDNEASPDASTPEVDVVNGAPPGDR